MAIRATMLASQDEIGWRGVGTRLASSATGSAVDADASGGNPGSRFGQSLTGGNDLTLGVEPGLTPAKQYMTFNYLLNFTNVDPSFAKGGGEDFLIMSSGSGDGAVAIGWRITSVDNEVTSGALYVRVSGAWTLIAGSAGSSFATPSGYHLWTLEVDATNKRARILKDGSEYVTWKSDTNIAGTHPSGMGRVLNGYLGAAGGGTLAFVIAHMFVIESDDADVANLADRSVIPMYPVATVTPGAWVTNGLTKCTEQLFRAVDYPEDLEGDTGDYMSEAGAGSTDSLFAFAPLPDGATVDGVMAVLVGPSSTSVEVLVELDGVTDVYTSATSPALTSTGVSGLAVVMLPTAPGSVAWTADVFRRIRAGVRAKASQAPTVNGFFLDVLGTGLARMRKNPPCHRRAGSVLGSANPGIY